MKRIQISINRGQVRTNFEGFEGDECTKLGEKIRPDNLKVERTELKPEYHLDPIDAQLQDTSYHNA